MMNSSTSSLDRGAALAPGVADQGGEAPDPGVILGQEAKVAVAAMVIMLAGNTAPERGAAPDPRIRTHLTALTPMR